MLALLNLVIPSPGVLLSPLNTASLIDDYDPMDYPFMPPSAAHEDPLFPSPPSSAPEFPWVPESLDLPLHLTSVDPLAGPAELIVSHDLQRLTEPMFDPSHCRIKSLALLYSDIPLSAVPNEVPLLDEVDARELIALFEDMDAPQDESQQTKPQQPQQLQQRQQQLLVACKKSKGKCAVAGCNTKMQSKGKCIRHGGGRRCVVEGCTRGAQTLRRCKRHGGGARCRVEGCGTSSQGGGLCRAHGGGRLCTAPGCKKGAQRQGKCSTHSSQQCSAANCLSVARCRGLCNRHKKQLQV
ncbi:unnamed protein product [Hyaloperonospora brassicae]|uniref:WRKY19-like zinc finger domain-containing protein n=1 Tax=Hyaloperonospora brassicae TaxID=162125 RepID=A0AAV0T522_HYABA|nr:unnamed protein product [Hyaloperonospora brassicae]